MEVSSQARKNGSSTSDSIPTDAESRVKISVPSDHIPETVAFTRRSGDSDLGCMAGVVCGLKCGLAERRAQSDEVTIRAAGIPNCRNVYRACR